MLKKIFNYCFAIFVGITSIVPMIKEIFICKNPGVSFLLILGIISVIALLIYFIQNSTSSSLPIVIERNGIKYYVNVQHVNKNLYQVEYRDDTGTLAPEIEYNISDMESIIKNLEKQLFAAKYIIDPE